MIQRKQTIWLLLSIIFMVFSIYIPFGHQAHAAPTESAVVTIDMKANFNFLLTIIVAVIIALAGFGIFLFKNRGLQKMICLLGFVSSIVLGIYEFILANNKADNYVLSFGIALPVGSALLFLMAWSGINADEKLIKSIYRLRD
jgi:hypothetical protein